MERRDPNALGGGVGMGWVGEGVGGGVKDTNQAEFPDFLIASGRSPESSAKIAPEKPAHLTKEAN